MKKFITNLIEVYIPNALFRLKLFFKPELKQDINEFVEDVNKVVFKHKWNMIQNKIRLLLMMEGYERDKIRFTGHPGYIRYGYWKGIDHETIHYIQEHAKIMLERFETYDEDCGWLYAYDIKERR